MRTKTTLLCAAALAAGVVGSYAQSNVYSLNIVGYANVPTGNGFTFQSNPFEVSPSDSATNVIPNPNTAQGGSYSGPWDSSNIQLWTGVGWNVFNFDSETSDTTTGFVNGNVQPLPTPTLGVGVGYLVDNGQGASNNITYVGTVRTGTNAIAYATSGRPYAIGSPLPLAGGVITTLGFVNPNTAQGGSYSGPLDSSAVEQLLVNHNGSPIGYAVSDFDSETSDSSTGFVNGNVQQVPEPQIPIGGGFFLLQETAGTYTWTQILNP